MQSLQRNDCLVLFFTFFFSLCLTGFGRPSDISFFSCIAATIGYALFWQKLYQLPLSSQQRFLSLWLLFFFSSLIQTRWLLSHPYSYIIAIWLFLSFSLSLPYAYLINFFFRSSLKLTTLLQVSALFAFLDILETKLFFCGISFRSIGVFFMANPFSSQLITLLGGSGLTFLVCLMNGSFLLLQHTKSLLNAFLLWIAPFALGFLLYFSLPTTYSSPLKAALFHFNKEALVDATAKAVIQDYQETWRKIFSYAPLLKKEKVDLIVLPEGIVPYSSNIALMEREEIPKEIVQSTLTDSSYLSSKEISQALSDYWNSALMIGMERKTTSPNATYYNTCFLFTPKRHFTFYDKQVLVPGGEYVPLERFFKPILLQYGIIGSFEQGRGPVLLHTPKVTLFPLICYEETLSQYVLPAIPLKADLLISISNDHWFPSPLFARDHWLLGKMRAMEIGMSLLRSSNLGKSGLILPNGTEPISNKMQKQEELLIFSFVPEKRKTLFSSLQETTILCILFLIPLCFSLFHRIRSKSRSLP